MKRTCTTTLAILANEHNNNHINWIRAIQESNEDIEYNIIELTKSNWLQAVGTSRANYFLAKPSGLTERFKQLYDERVFIISEILKRPVFPCYHEILVYENKRMLSYWLNAHGIDHPKTFISYYKDEAVEYLNKARYPVVAKINIGASGRGVSILSNPSEGQRYVNEVFSKKGKTPGFGPNFNHKGLWIRSLKAILNPDRLKERTAVYQSIARNPQRDFVLFQEYIPHEFEWRVVRIGDSFFAHKKLVRNGKASGSLKKDYSDPPLELLTYVKIITDKLGFYSQAVDLFETRPDEYLVNEMQCIFGQSDPHQMLVNNTPGRYIFREKWIFEEGDFNRNESYDLRLKFVLEKIK